MVLRLAGALAIALSLISCEPGVETVDNAPDCQSIIAAERFVDAFYSFDPSALRSALSSAEESLPKLLFYQGWAEGGNYEIIERMPCELREDGIISCSITVEDDLIGALGIDFNVTDTFHMTVSGRQIVAVTNSSNDPQAYWDAETWVRKNNPKLIERPCRGFFNGGPTPGDCVRAMVRGYSEFASQAGLLGGSVTSK